MNARATRRAVGGPTGRWAGLRALAMLALVVALGQACSDNKGPAGPKFPAGQTGTSDGGIVAFISANPNTIEPGRRAGITVVVQTPNGVPIPGRQVSLGTTVGRLDSVNGVTNAQGRFSTSLFISPEDAARAVAQFALVTAFVESLPEVISVQIFFGTPAIFTISPDVVARTFGAGGAAPGTCPNVGSFAVQFTVSGGTPPYRFSTSGSLGASITSSGRLTVPPIGPVIGGFQAIDTVTVVDETGQQVTASVTVTCTPSGV